MITTLQLIGEPHIAQHLMYIVQYAYNQIACECVISKRIAIGGILSPGSLTHFVKMNISKNVHAHTALKHLMFCV